MHFKELIIFHYHLRKGGVTDVVLLSLQALAGSLPGDVSIRVVAGCRDNLESVQQRLHKSLKHPINVSWDILPELNYLEAIKSPPDSSSLARLLLTRYGGREKLWWVHNYHLGKNPLFTSALLKAAQREQPLLFQIHDFPECARYENLEKLRKGVQEEIYPVYPWVKYALINPRDLRLLQEAGIPSSLLFLLENPVPLQPLPEGDPLRIKKEMGLAWKKDFPAFDPEGALLLYPVRAIRRKNILEAGFLVKLLNRSANLLVTLPGISESESAYSALVEKAFREGLIPGACGVGMRPDTPWLNYENFWLAADMILSSSIQEGFGYLFLNSLHWQKPLCARYLDIMEGFSSLFPEESTHFYHEVHAPLSEDQSERTLLEYRQKLEDLKVYMGEEKIRGLLSEVEEKLQDKKLCFSYLPATIQLEIIQKIQEDKAYRSLCRQSNEKLLHRMEKMLKTAVPDSDRIIEQAYGKENYWNTLMQILESYAEPTGPVEQSGDPVQQVLIEGFTTLPYVRLLY